MNSSVGDLFGGSRRIRDDVWGDIQINRAVRSLLDTEAMKRVAGMRQMGFGSPLFPASRHTRTDHALGVYHLTRMTLNRITDSGVYLEDREIQGAMAAALLLDVGRYPYAASLEKIALPGMVGRKELNRRWIEQSPLADVLRKEWDLEPHNVFRLVTRETDLPISITPTEYLIQDILFGTLDLYTLDAMMRDAKSTKVPYNLVELEPLIRHLRVVGQKNRAVLCIDEDGAGSLQSLMFSRYLMSYNVYGHYSFRIPDAMFARAVQDAIQDEKLSPDNIPPLDDAGIFDRAQNSADEGSSTKALTRRISDRRPYLRALELDARHPNYDSLLRLRDDSSWRRRVEEAWSRYLTRYRKGQAAPYEILIDLPSRREEKVSSAELGYIRRTPLPGERNLTDWPGLSGMSREEVHRQNLPLHRILICAANPDLVQSVRRHTDELFTIAEEIG